jgi:hypothetical protein
MHRVGAIGRRGFLQLASAIVGIAAVIDKASAAPCATVAGDGGLHESLHYVETSPNPAQVCAACAFFSKPAGSCGECQIFNGPVNVKGHCDSWSARS